MIAPHWFTDTQTDMPISQLPVTPALPSFLLAVRVTCKALAFDTGRVGELGNVIGDLWVEVDGVGSVTRLTEAEAGGGSFEGAMGLDGRLDNDEHDDHSISGLGDMALRLSERTAAGILGVGWDIEAEDLGVSFSLPFNFVLAFPARSGEEELLPFNGDDRCFPIAVYRYFMLFDLRVLGSPKGCEVESLSERCASSSERPGESISCSAKFAEARLAALRVESPRSNPLASFFGVDMDHEQCAWCRRRKEFDGFG